MCNPILITNHKSRSVGRTPCENTIISGSVSVFFPVTLLKCCPTSTSLRIHCIYLTVAQVIFLFIFTRRSDKHHLFHHLLSFVLFAFLKIMFYYLWRLHHKVFEIYLPFRKKVPGRACVIIQLNSSSLRNHCLHRYFYRNSQKTATRRSFEQLVVNQRVRHILCRRTPPPSSKEFVSLLWVCKLLWMSAVFPVSWASVLGFVWVGD